MAMVFQNYALYPNMTVYLAYALKIRKVQKGNSRRGFIRWQKILEIESLLDQVGHQLFLEDRSRELP